MPEKIDQEQAANYKNRWVSKYLEKNPIKEIEQLPDDLKRLWSQGKYKKFLESALEKLERLKTLQKVCKALDVSDEQEIREHLQDIDYTLEKFKNYLRGQHKDKKKVKRAVKQLRTDQEELLNNRLNWKKILKNALREFARHLKLLKCLWPICPILGLSNERKVHELVQRFYYCERDYYSDYQEISDLTGSRYAYIINTEMTELLPRDWLKKMGQKYREKRHKARISQARFLTMLKKKLRVTDNHCACDVEKLTFKVESELKRKFQETLELQDGSLLFKAANKFLSSTGIWLKLDGQFLKLPGVYFLYYIGKKELYPGSFIIGSSSVPVYVGKSESDISSRLRVHRAKIGRAKDLDVADFAVKVMFVDNRHYAPCIEGMFIEHFVPVWNSETLGISFGSQNNSLWKKYHVEKDPAIIQHMEQKLKI